MNERTISNSLKPHRNERLDALKYFLIVMVVVGHFIQPATSNSPIAKILFHVIYSFHMPLFIWLCGYFYNPRTLGKELRRNLGLLELFVVFHLVNIALKDGNYTITSIYNVDGIEWFLLSLVFWRMMSVPLLCYISTKRLVVLSVAISLLLFPLLDTQGVFLSLGRTLMFYPYFILGYIMKRGELELPKRLTFRSLAIGGVLTGNNCTL